MSSSFVRLLSSVFLIVCAARGQSVAGEETGQGSVDVVFRFEAADGTPLAAKLTVPASAGEPFPVVFYLHGAGPRTYDNPYGYADAEGQRAVGSFLDFPAEELARRGVAFCRMSKRGCEAVTEPRSMKLDREVFAKATPGVILSDYERGLAVLRERSDVDAERIILVGASEGTWIAPRLAQRSADGVIGIYLLGYAGDNMHDTVVWQNSTGPWRNIQHLLPPARDGELSKDEYTEMVKDRPYLKRAIPFDAMDVDHDGKLSPDDMRRVNEPRLKLILEAVEQRNDDFLWKHLLNLSSGYLLEWWDAEPTHVQLLELSVPIAIYHGALDGTCRVESVYEVERAFEQANRTNLSIHVYPTADHNLNWSRLTPGGSKPYQDVFDAIAEVAGK